MSRLLVVDDEPNVLYSIEKALRSNTVEVVTALTGREAIELIASQHPDVVILDVRLSDMSGLDLFDRIRQIDSRLPVIVITAFASTETAIEATKRGAYEYILKPIELLQLREVVQRALELSRFRHVPAIFDEAVSAENAERIVGRSLAMQEVYKAIGRVASSDVTVLITGESGTGKEMVARALYHHSGRADKPFLTINCAAIPETLLESELFGHERGAFTGAERRRIGKFEQADGGTLLLDEIGDMTAATQAKVLRVLQDQSFERLGGETTIRTDVRILAATNKDLEQEIAAGRFRADLFYRLNVFSIHLPPLRERREDVPLLVENFLKQFNHEMGRSVRSVSPEALERLVNYDWPGNVRQLQSMLKYAFIQVSGDIITPDCLPQNLCAEVPPSLPPPVVAPDLAFLTLSLLRAGESDIYRRVCTEVDRVVLQTVLHYVNGNQVRASDLLGISRTTLRSKLRALAPSGERPLIQDADPVAGP
jgi:two-component system nitrogen regulation response regulator GlnG